MRELANTTDGNPGESAVPKQTAIEQTLDHAPASEMQETTAFSGSKQSRDLAFAVALLQTGYGNMRGLTNAAKSWTTHGSQTLADHLVSRKAISGQQRTVVERRAQRALSDALEPLSGATAKGDSNSVHAPSLFRNRDWVSKLDPSGKIAKLLGIADTSVLAGDQIEDRQLGSRYTLLRKLGQGGLGVVWLARDQNLQRYVAVKEIVKTSGTSDAAVEHFRREAEITGRLEHPGIVPIYQYGEDDVTGKSFYVMRFLGKRTMQDAISEYHERRESGNDDPMLLHRLLSALISVCHSVGHAHSKKVIHRDLKPENVALDEFGQVTLLDWGLAMINDASGMYEVNGKSEPGDLHSVGSTQVGRVLGTPLYMAPEQAAGRLEEVDHLTDVYALGGMLYAILTGMGPHQSTMEEADSKSNLSDIMSKIVSEEVSAPKSIVSSTSPELNAVCMKALSSKRYLRYESASEFADEIQRYIAGSPVKAYAPPRKQKLHRWMSLHPTLTQTILLAASLLVLGGSAIALTARNGRQALQDAKYTALRELTREIEATLNFETDGLVRDLQFVSDLPLMDALVASSRKESEETSESPGPIQPPMDASEIDTNQQPSQGQPSDFTLALENASTETLLDRQGNLYDGLLHANPSYLLACTCIKKSDGSMHEAVRSERVLSGRRVHRVPEKQLRYTKEEDQPKSEKQLVEALRSEQVLLITNDQLSPEVPVDNRSPLVLSGIRPVLDVDGDLFGINILELDLQQRLQQLLAAVSPEGVTVLITDTSGNVALRYANRRLQNATGSDVEHLAEIQELFQSSSDSSVEFGDGKAIFARRTQLGGAAMAQIGIIALHEK